MMKTESGKRKAAGAPAAFSRGTGPAGVSLPFASPRSAFTLVEMMAVVAVIGLMLLVSLPAINSLGRSSELSNAARQFNNALVMARQTAITRNMRTRVVITFATSGARTIPQPGSQENPPDMQAMTLSAYAIMGQASGTTNVSTTTTVSSSTRLGQQPWEYLQAWRFLPKGVIFDPSTVTLRSVDRYQTQLDGSTLFFYAQARDPDLPFPDNVSDTLRNKRRGPLAFVEFRPTGVPTLGAAVRIVNGIVDGNGNVTVPGRRVWNTPSTTATPEDPARLNSVVLRWDNIVGRIEWIQPGT